MILVEKKKKDKKLGEELVNFYVLSLSALVASGMMTTLCIHFLGNTFGFDNLWLPLISTLLVTGVTLLMYHLVAYKSFGDKMFYFAKPKINNMMYVAVLLGVVLFFFSDTDCFKENAMTPFGVQMYLEHVLLFPDDENMDGIMYCYQLVGFYFTTIFAPVTEEHLFRGILYPYLKTQMSIAEANLLQGFLFGAFHISEQSLIVTYIMLRLNESYMKVQSALTGEDYDAMTENEKAVMKTSFLHAFIANVTSRSLTGVGVAVMKDATGSILTPILFHSLHNLTVSNATCASILMEEPGTENMVVQKGPQTKIQKMKKILKL